MTENTFSSTFRRIDVDQYFNEDNFREEVSCDTSSIPEENVVTSLLSQGKHCDALKLVLKDIPLGIKNLQLREKSLKMVMKVLLSTKYSQIEEIVNELNTDQLDILMKFIYRGFEVPSEGSSSHLLAWHEKTFTVAGIGSIIRVLTDNVRA